MFKKSLIALALTAAAASSFAQVYVQGAVGQGNINVDWGSTATNTKNSASGSKFLVGYELSNGWSVEGLVINYGKSIGTVSAVNGEVKASGYGIGGAYTQQADKWLFRAGAALNSNKLAIGVAAGTLTATAAQTSAQANLNLGVGYKINDTFHVTADYDFSNAKYGTGSGSTAGVSLLSIGLRAKF